ncbi:MAG: glycosyltransferase family 4 protein [Thaumarchaeota archaeon]|nr:glycosyltransferase family 4 protein [Nitrososphaerota archaeon]
MKIGIIHGFVGGGGGTEKTLYAIIESLTERGHKVTLYTFSKPSITIPGIKIISTLPFHLPVLGLYQRYMESKLIEKAKDDDLIIQASGGMVLPRKKDQKVIIYCHHDFQNETKKDITKYKGVWSWYYKPYYFMIQQFIKQIRDQNIILIANSKFTHDSIMESFSKDSSIIYPPVTFSEFSKDVKKEKNVITISRYSQEKNLEFAIDVMSGIDANYNIIGNTKTRFNEVYYDNLTLKVHVKKSNSKIILYKNIPRSNVVTQLDKAKVYFHASPETFGITVVESIVAGCIPIVPDNSAHTETVPFSELRYVPNDVDDARNKLKKSIAGDFDYLLGDLKKLSENYSKENFKKNFINFVENVKF